MNDMKEQFALLRDELIQLSRYIYDNPELGYEEFKSCAAHAALLRKHGFTVEENYLGIPTAFRAEYAGEKPGPSIGFLSEYDALPQIGHGCGHNIMGTVTTGAGILLSKRIDEIGGRAVVFGTPAEETSGAKVTLSEKGAFDDIAAALISHPYSKDMESGTSLAIEAIQFTFHGRASHAAAAPEKGINALDACITAFNSINALREHVLPSARIHGIIKEGGVAANIVPELSIAQFYVRTTEKAYLKELCRKVENCARAGALAAGAEVEISRFELGYDNLLTNRALQDCLNENLNRMGITDILAGESAGSTDVGNVSHVCPTLQPCFNICAPGESYPTHSEGFRDATLRQPALEAMEKNVCALAMTGADIIENEELLQRIRSEFVQSTAND